jgi:hypothetical protein
MNTFFLVVFLGLACFEGESMLLLEGALILECLAHNL